MSKKKKRRLEAEKLAAIEPAAAAGPRPKSRHAWLFAVVVVLLVGAINFITMPSMFYPGDNFAARMELADWLTTGKLGIDYSHRQELGGFVENRGQYLYENDARQKFFSKYGFGCTLMYAPPYLWQKWTAGGSLNTPSDSLLFKMNVWQVVLSMVFAFYLFRTARLFTESDWLAAAFLFLSIYCTFAWHYVRSPTLEILQTVPFAASTYHLLAFARRRSETAAAEQIGAESGSKGSLGPWLHLAASCLWAGLLVLTKLVFAVHMAAIVTVAALAGFWRGGFRAMMAGILRDWGKYAVYMAVPLSLSVAVVLWSNWYRFGSILNTGYGQWLESSGVSVARMSLTFVPKIMKGMFVDMNEYNVFIAFPVFAFALLGYRGFARRYGREAMILLVVVLANLVPNAMYSCWPGSWCYGPRFQIQIMFILALPFLGVLEWMLKRIWTFRGSAFALIVAVVLSVSFYLQVQVNSLHYFAATYAAGMFQQFKIPAMDKVFASKSWGFHLGIRHADLKAYLAGRRSYALVEVVRQVAPPEQWPRIKAQIDANLKQMAKPNYYFFD